MKIYLIKTVLHTTNLKCNLHPVVKQCCVDYLMQSSQLKHSISFLISIPSTPRLIKESKYYEEEVIQNEQKLQQMKDENRDPHDIKKFQEVLSESHMMIPDSICRRDKALGDLKEFLAALDDGELDGNEWMVEAEKLLSEAGLGEKVEKEMDGDVIETSVDGLAEGEAF